MKKNDDFIDRVVIPVMISMMCLVGITTLVCVMALIIGGAK